MAGPANQTCATAVVVASTLPSGYQLDTTLAATDAQTATCIPTANKAVWYTWTCPTGITTLIVSTTDTPYKTAVAAFTGSCGALVEVGCQVANLTPHFPVRLVLDVTAGTTYFFLIAAPNNDGGILTLNFASATTVSPTNISPETAYEITCGPATFLEDVSDVATGTGYTSSCLTNEFREVWFKWTAPKTQGFAVNVRPYDADNDAYFPIAQVWTGTLGSLTQVQTDWCSNSSVTIDLPAIEGEDYYIQITDDTGFGDPCHLIFDFLIPPDVDATDGALFINADEDGIPATLLSTVDGSLLQVRPFPAGELGNISLSNSMLCVIGGEAIEGDRVKFYDPTTADWTLVTTATFTGSTVTCIATNRVDKFYVITKTVSNSHLVVRQFSDVGVAGTTWDLGVIVNDIGPATVARDDSVIFYTDASQGAGSQTVHRYSLATSAPLANLVGTLPHVSFKDAFTGSDGTVYFYCKSGTQAFVYGLHPTTGATVFTYTGLSDIDHMAPDPDDLSFWSWTVNLVTNIARFVRILISDGSTLSDFSVPFAISTGFSHPNQFAWLMSQSCPLMVLPPTTNISVPICPPSSQTIGSDCTYVSGITTCTEGNTIPGPLAPYAPGSPSPPTPTGTPVITRRLRRFPIAFEQGLPIFLHRLAVILQTGVGLTTGQGSDPKLMLRLSSDGGHTWGPEQDLTMGKIGEYRAIAETFSCGVGENWVGELTVSDPVFAGLIDCIVDVTVSPSPFSS